MAFFLSKKNLQYNPLIISTTRKKKVVLTADEEEKLSTRFKNQVSSIYDFALSHPTQQTEATKGSLWGAYNSISGYYNYIANFKNEEQKFTSQLFGNGNSKILKGFNKALEII